MISDTHFGYGSNTELENDSYENANEAMTKAIQNGADVILLPGDIFDSRIPNTSVWARAIPILVKPLREESRGVNVVKTDKELNSISQRTLQHLPVIAIHGTHERRHGMNAIEVLDRAGLLIHIDKQMICLEKNGVRVAIHGMSGVPDRYAKNVMDEWNPQPVEDCANILVMHQSIDPYIYSPLGNISIKADELPTGFDLIVNGHLHIRGKEVVNGTPLILPGSTVITQFEINEAETEKGYYEIDVLPSNKMDIKFVPLKDSRRFYFNELLADTRLKDKIEVQMNNIISLNPKKKPLVKFRIKGSQFDVVEQELKEIARKYDQQAIVRFVKELESPEIEKKIEFLRQVKNEKLSVEEMGLRLLSENLNGLNFEKSFNQDKIFGILVDGNVEGAFDILTGRQKTLETIL